MRARMEVEGLYAMHGRSVFRRARALLSNGDAAADACQEVFLKVIRLDDPQSLLQNPLAWLYRTTTNLCLNRLRDEKRRAELLASWQPDEQFHQQGESRATVQRILRDVPPDLQEAAVYYYVDGLSHDEIAELMGSSRRTVGNRLAAFHAQVDLLVKSELVS